MEYFSGRAIRAHVLYTGLLSIWTLSFAQYYKDDSVSGNGCFLSQVKTPMFPLIAVSGSGSCVQILFEI
jgi:hypothetical protein